MIQGLLIIVLMAGMLLLPAAAMAQNEPLAYEAEQTIAPSLARQGDFALRLAQSLALPNAEDEGGAIRALDALGVHAVDGWMADYPMTPQIVSELRDAVIATAAVGQLNMGVDAALHAYVELVAEFGLPLPADPAPGYAGVGAPATAYIPYCDGTALNYYYDSFGTPVYTYCPPPPAYLYLYSWVPCGFQWQGQVFTGFFIQRHIDRIPRHARHVDQRHDRIGEKHDHDRQSHRWVSRTATSPPGDQVPPPSHERRHEFGDDDRRHAATSGDAKETQHRPPQALGVSPPRAMVRAGAVSSPAAPGAVIIHRTYGDRVWTGARPVTSAAHAPGALIPPAPVRSAVNNNGVARHRVAPTLSGNPSAQPPTSSRVRVVAPPHAVSRPAPAPVVATSTPVPAPSVVVPIERRSVSRETPRWDSSDGHTGASRRLGFAQ